MMRLAPRVGRFAALACAERGVVGVRGLPVVAVQERFRDVDGPQRRGRGKPGRAFGTKKFSFRNPQKHKSKAGFLPGGVTIEHMPSGKGIAMSGVTLTHESRHHHRHRGHSGHTPHDKRSSSRERLASHDKKGNRRDRHASKGGKPNTDENEDEDHDTVASSAQEENRLVVVFLHGMGGSGVAWARRALHGVLTRDTDVDGVPEQRARMRGVRVVLPDAPEQLFVQTLPHRMMDFASLSEDIVPGEAKKLRRQAKLERKENPEEDTAPSVTARVTDVAEDGSVLPIEDVEYPVPSLVSSRAWYLPPITRNGFVLAGEGSLVERADVNDDSFNLSVSHVQGLLRREAAGVDLVDRHEGHKNETAVSHAEKPKLLVCGFGQGSVVAAAAIMRMTREEREELGLVGIASLSGSLWPWSASEMDRWRSDEDLQALPWLNVFGAHSDVVDHNDSLPLFDRLCEEAGLEGMRKIEETQGQNDFSDLARDSLHNFIAEVFNLPKNK